MMVGENQKVIVVWVGEEFKLGQLYTLLVTRQKKKIIAYWWESATSIGILPKSTAWGQHKIRVIILGADL